MVKMLAVITLLGTTCGILLTATNAITEPRIQLQRQQHALALLQTMIKRPLEARINIDAPVFGACDEWLGMQLTASGYAGPIDALGVWHAADQGLSIRVNSHRETPGIGDFIDTDKSRWMSQLDHGHRATFAAVDRVSGATVTTNAIRALAEQAFNIQVTHCEQ